MAEAYEGRHEAAVPDVPDGVNVQANAVADEESGTPPQIPATVRTAVYVGCLILNFLTLMVFGILPVFDILDAGKAAQVANIVIVGINMISLGLAVGYRPTRPGSPLA